MKELVKAENQNTGIIESIGRMAINPDVDVEKIGKLLDMQERVIDKQSKLEYNQAMAQCQADMPTVIKDTINQQTKSRYAQFETVLITTKPTYTANGFSISFGTDQSPLEHHIRVTCTVMHSGGHSENVFADLPLDIAGIKGNENKTKMHAMGSTFSYGKRYLFCMVFNIAIAEEDKDGNLPSDITVNKLLEYNACVREHFQTIAAVKAAFEEADWTTAIEAWEELTEDEKNSLWKAPSKGGAFTTAEIKIFKSNELSAARKEYFGRETA